MRSLYRCLCLLGLVVLAVACVGNSAEIPIPSIQMDTTIPDVPLVANYAIDVTLDADSKQLTATQTIQYTNTTADPFSDLIFHLYLNGFQEGSYFMGEADGLRGFGFDRDAPGSIEVGEIRVNGDAVTLMPLEDGTLAQVDLGFAVGQGETVEVTLDYTAQLPRASARTGFGDNDFFMVGQWFPKLGVWEDGGWNAYPFYPNNEFYADFGVYDVDVTVPEGFVVGGSGVQTGAISNGDGTITVSYHAEPVIDFAWTASPNYSIATRDFMGVELVYLYLEEANGDTSDRVLTAAQHGLRTNADWFGPYPYERLTLVDVPPDAAGAGGMEYPTLVTVGDLGGSMFGPAASRTRIVEAVTIHEVGHQWFQSMVATNEVEEPWLDEGMTDFATTLGMTAGYGQANTFESYLLDVDGLEMRRLEYLTSSNVPMFGSAENLQNYGVSAYSKPNIGLVTLQRVLGDDMMKEIMRSYFMRYRFQHPTTADFRTVAEEVSAQNLDWFFDGMVIGNGVLNYAVSDLSTNSFTVVREGDLHIPVEILVTFTDSTTTLLSWDDAEATALTESFDKAIVGVEIDPERKILMDMRWLDNGRTNSADINAWLNIITRWLYKAQDLSLLLGGL